MKGPHNGTAKCIYIYIYIKRIICFIVLTALLLTSFSAAYAANSEGTETNLRVGFMDYPGYLEEDENGNIVGYIAEYLDKISQHTGWSIEYVGAPWHEQLNMLDRGELDLVPLAQYSPERSEKYLFTKIPFGFFQCMLFAPQGKASSPMSTAQLCDGKRIGAIKDSVIIPLLESFAENEGFSYTLCEYDYLSDMFTALNAGEIDFYASEQTKTSDELRVIGRFGFDPHYCIASKKSGELIKELDYVMCEISAFEPEYQGLLYRQYLGNGTNSAIHFSNEELNLISQCGEVTIVLQANNKPSSYLDESGIPAGITPDILDEVSELCGISFKYIFSPDGEPTIYYTRSNPDYLVGGVLASNNAFQSQDYICSDVYFSTYCSLVTRSDEAEKIDLLSGEYKVGMLSSFYTLQYYTSRNYPNAIIELYDDINSGMQALVDGNIDAFVHSRNAIMSLLGNPRYGNTSIVESNFMTNDQFVAAVNTERNRMLISIINKCIAQIPGEEIANIENNNLRKAIYRFDSSDILYRYRDIIISFLFLLALCFSCLITVLFVRQRNISKVIALRSELDLTTEVYNKATLLAKIQQYLSNNKGTSCAFIIIDIDNLKTINDTLGHQAGDRAINSISHALKTQLRNVDIVGRMGGDEFAAFLVGISSKEILNQVVERFRKSVAETKFDDGTRLSCSIGIALGTAGLSSIDTLYRNADEALYRIKQNGKNGFAYYCDNMKSNMLSENEA